MHKGIRNSNIELLRIFLSVLVIILHTNNPSDGGVIEYAKEISYQAELLTLVTELVAICAVNTFVIITGYFLSSTDKRNPWKIVELFFLCALFSGLKYLVIQIVDGESVQFGDVLFRCIPNNYYITLYSVIYLISPLINKAFLNSKKKVWQYTIGILILFSVIPSILSIVSEVWGQTFNGLSTIGNGGAQGGYTVVNFAMMYVIGLCIRRNDEKVVSTPLWEYIALEAVILVLLVFWEHIHIQIEDTIWGSVLNYYNVLVVLEAIVLFCIFRKLNICSKVVNEIARCSIIVYLFHGAFVLTISYRDIIASNGILLSELFIIIISVGIFFACYPLWKLYEISFGKLFGDISRRFAFHNIFSD